MQQRLLRFLPSLISAVFLGASIWVICQELQQYESRDIWRQLTAIPRSDVGWAIAITFLNCWIFTGYDTLAARYVRHSLPYFQTALAAAISIPISNSLGLALLSGSATRYRLYLSWGISPLKSNIPGGLGIFETVMLLLLPPAVSSTALFGSLVAYHAVYYLLSLSVAMLLLAAYEIRSRQVED